MDAADTIVIDGSSGEGGGQILRSALALSIVTGKPFRIERIRAGRERPGLLRQHLTAVHAASAVSGAEIEGAAIGSPTLTFFPGRARAGAYSFSIGTAGSTTLVLQTVLPALLAAPGASTLVIEGGTHNPAAPTADFLRDAFLPLLLRMGAHVEVTLDRHGFYPAGGGRIAATIVPAAHPRPLDLVERGAILGRRAVASVAALPGEIAKRELAVIGEMLGWGPDSLRIVQLGDGVGPGNVLSIAVGSERVTEVFTGFGQRGVSAEAVAKGAAEQVREYLKAGVPVWEHLADQLLLPMALGAGGVFRTGPLSSHARTNITVIERFLGARFQVAEDTAGATEVRVSVH